MECRDGAVEVRTGDSKKEKPQGPSWAFLSSRKQRCGQRPSESLGLFPSVSMSPSTWEGEGENQGGGNKAR